MDRKKRNKLIVILGPTAIGKTRVSVDMAKRINSSIISADSRQIFKEIPIGTAAVSTAEMDGIPHYFVASHSIRDNYGARNFEDDVISLLPHLFEENDIQLMVGGSMMYIDAVCKGIDDMPDVDMEVREAVYKRYETEGLCDILKHLKELDPVYYDKVDKNNYKRVLHGYEICLSTGMPYSSFLKGRIKERDFDIIKIRLDMPNDELYKRIDRRVDEMIENGLEDECRKVYHLRHLNSLNTVGYKEMFCYFDGIISFDKAVSLIKKNTRTYARKQKTWWKKDNSMITVPYNDTDTIYKLIYS